MYSDPGHENLMHGQMSNLEDCFEDAMMEDRDIEVCFGNFGGEVLVWPHGYGPHPHCCRILVIKADDWYNLHRNPARLIDAIRDYIRNCPMVERIIIQGSEFSMRGLKLVSASCNIDLKFAAYIAGINVLKDPPVVVSCLTLRGAGPTRHIVKHFCV